ncbi:MAG: hypothetical protein JJ863_24040 [Deltaproteobacteria bacterium]|nr:hypothetical protein [Deltaproteobacteria bacterium]
MSPQRGWSRYGLLALLLSAAAGAAHPSTVDDALAQTPLLPSHRCQRGDLVVRASAGDGLDCISLPTCDRGEVLRTERGALRCERIHPECDAGEVLVAGRYRWSCRATVDLLPECRRGQSLVMGDRRWECAGP